MSVTAPPTLTAPPTAPTTDRATFSARAFAMVAWFATMVSEMTSALSNVYNNASEAFASSQSAAASASAAQAVAGAQLHNPATNYTQGQAAVSGLNWLTYRRKTAGSSATDPRDDPTNWALASKTPTVAEDVSVNTVTVAGQIYRATASCTLTLPASPTRGDTVTVMKTSSAYTVTVARNGHKIRGVADNASVSTANRYYTLMYFDTSVGFDLI